MRRVRSLGYCDYVTPIGRTASSLMALSNNNCLLKKTWHSQEYTLLPSLHVKFNASTMNGIQIRACLEKNGKPVNSGMNFLKLFRVSESGYNKTLIYTFPMSLGTEYEYTLSQADLTTNELSGMETYLVQVSFFRRKKKYFKEVYFNHLGCFDNINRLRQHLELIEIYKGDE